MSRGVRDLRDLICVSRLTVRDSDEEILSDDDQLVKSLGHISLSSSGTDSRQSSANSVHGKREPKSPDSGIATNGISPDSPSTTTQAATLPYGPQPPKSEKPTKARKKRRKKKALDTLPTMHELPKPNPLPPVQRSDSWGSRPSTSSSSGGSGDVSSPIPPVLSKNKVKTQTAERQGNFEDLLTFIDATFVGEWLMHSNKVVGDLSHWCHTDDNFVQFAHFWLSDFSVMQQQQIFKLEHSILLDHLGLAFAAGRDSGKVRHRDIVDFLGAVFREYPGRLLSSRGLHLFLSVLETLTSERQESYKKLLADVKVSTRNKQHAQWVLAIRAFCLVSVWNAIVDFYRKLLSNSSTKGGLPVLHVISKKGDINEQRMYQAIRNGYVDVVNYYVKTRRVDPNIIDSHGKTLVFSAVMHSQPQVLRYLLSQVRPTIDANRPADTGNTALHAACNSGDVRLVNVLLKAEGINVNPKNPQCDNATPLHLAVMHGHKNVVEMLLTAHADKTVQMGDLTPVDIARDFDHQEILQMLQNDGH